MRNAWIKNLVKRLLPAQVIRRMRGKRGLHPPIGCVRLGDLRRLTPISRSFGFDRGQPIDRYYIERFLARQAEDIHGRVLEIGDATYTRRFGGERVTNVEVLHAVAGNPKATLVGDLSTGEGIPSHAFDCLILTQTLPFIFDIRLVMAHVFRALAPGGVILATVPGISQISRYDMDRWGDFWRFTTLSARRLCEEQFPIDAITVETYGNVKTAAAFLYGLATEDIPPRDLAKHDPDYQLLITIRAQKPEVSI